VPIPDFAAVEIVFDGATVVVTDEVVTTVETGEVDAVLDEQDTAKSAVINNIDKKYGKVNCFIFFPFRRI
jgi:hypothetical protein